MPDTSTSAATDEKVLIQYEEKSHGPRQATTAKVTSSGSTFARGAGRDVGLVLLAMVPASSRDHSEVAVVARQADAAPLLPEHGEDGDDERRRRAVALQAGLQVGHRLDDADEDAAEDGPAERTHASDAPRRAPE